jgi:hypothetical protein
VKTIIYDRPNVAGIATYRHQIGISQTIVGATITKVRRIGLKQPMYVIYIRRSKL